MFASTNKCVSTLLTYNTSNAFGSPQRIQFAAETALDTYEYVVYIARQSTKRINESLHQRACFVCEYAPPPPQSCRMANALVRRQIVLNVSTYILHAFRWVILILYLHIYRILSNYYTALQAIYTYTQSNWTFTKFLRDLLLLYIHVQHMCVCRR